jgi:hypothetical protein
VLLETRSEDVRQAIRAAIEDCQQQLGQLDEAAKRAELLRSDSNNKRRSNR